jgi:uncharacterized protein
MPDLRGLGMVFLFGLYGCTEKPPALPVREQTRSQQPPATDSDTLPADELVPLNQPITHHRPAPAKAGALYAREIDWLDLMSAADKKRLEQGDLAVAHDSPEGAFSLGMKSRQAPGFAAVHSFDHQRIRLAGYFVPLEQTDAGQLLEILFVPYYGACIHVPPPPANQIIYAKLQKPMSETSMFDAYWLEGTLVAEPHNNDIAETVYSMQDASLTLWE